MTDYIQEFFPTHSCFVIADDTVADLYGTRLQQAFADLQSFRGILEFPAGEASKNRKHKDALEDQLLAQKAGRDSLIIAMGGGVTGDMAGYVAATLHRGLPLIHLPTSLLAQVDSSVGGKVGINHPSGKNLIGAFYQPQAVFADMDFLKTLSDEEFFNGMGEVIKYAVILDDELWQILEDKSAAIINRDPVLLQEVVTRCAALKIQVVEADEKESSYRSILNYGHTVGHAIEQLGQYKLKHGFAIAAGMRIAAKLSERVLDYPASRVERLNKLLDTYHLDQVDYRDYDFEAIWECLKTDKKSRQQKPKFSLMNKNNQPELLYPIEKAELQDVFFGE